MYPAALAAEVRLLLGSKLPSGAKALTDCGAMRHG